FLSKIVRNNDFVRSYSFTHSLVTSFGMSFYEQITAIIARDNFDQVETQWKAPQKISKLRNKKIKDIIVGLGNGTRIPNTKREINEILSVPNRNMNKVKSDETVDVYLRKKNKEYYIDIKTVKPNSPGFKAHKTKILEWLARADSSIVAFIAFPYNPYYPKKYQRFGMDVYMDKYDIKIGSEYWDFVGGRGCYGDLMRIFDSVGKKYWNETIKKIRS
ncbi:MAG: TdeIII family type II restriction endonuclease, partial [Thaumarchaeota archaeon]|nr:TdeIII family type II restriction endonuclease [Nitrososphaerota archaeon]